MRRRELLAGAAAAAALAACPRPPRRAAAAGDAHDPELLADVGRVLWVGFTGLVAPPRLLAAVAAGEVGGVLLFRRNVASPAQVAELTASLHAAGPVLVAADQEGGRVQVIREPATRWPAAARLGAHPDGERLAAEVGHAVGRELAALGVDVDLAPVCDVLVPAAAGPGGGVIGDRAFGDDPARVAALAGAFAAGLGRAGVLACGKHFPGHGGVAADSHATLPVSQRSAAELESTELVPFASLAPRLPLLMTAHVAYPALAAGSELPATCEPRLAGALLRDRLGFAGLLLSDDLGMGAIAARFSLEEAAVRAVGAGCDALLVAHRPDGWSRTRRALLAAASADPELRARLREAAARGSALGRSHAAARIATPPPTLDVIGSPAHQTLAKQIE